LIAQRRAGVRGQLSLRFRELGGLVRANGARRALAYGARVLIALYAANAFWSYPDYLVHFNSLAGGPERGLTWSVVGEDWGQDMVALARFCEKNHIKQINYNPYGWVDPKAYGVPYVRFKCGTVSEGWHAVHLVDLRRPKSLDQKCYSQFQSLQPHDVLHHTIYLYYLPAAAESGRERTKTPRPE